MKSFYLLIAHGSPRKESNAELFELIAKFKKLYSHRYVEGCFLGSVKPDIEEGLEHCVRLGAEEIIILPLMVFSGKHVAQDIPMIVEKVKSRHPLISFHFAPPLADHPLLLELLDQQIKKMSGKV